MSENARPLACASCGNDASVHSSDIVVCEECLGRHHAACWQGRCVCGATGALGPFSEGDLPQNEIAPTVLPGRSERRRRKGPLVALAAVAGVSGVALVAARVASAPWEAFRREAMLVPPPETSATSEDAAALCREARALDEALDFDGAIGKYTRAIEVEPTRHEAWLGRAWVHEHRHDYSGAVADATRALELRPGDVHGFWPRVRGKAALGDLTGTLEDYELAMEIAPQDADCWSGRGYVRGLAGNYEGSLTDCTRAIELAPTYAYAWNNRGYARMHLGDLDGAAADIERSLELDPKNAYAWENRGHLRLLRGDTEGVRADFEKSLAVDTYHERTAAVTQALVVPAR